MNLENALGFKKLFKEFGSENLEFREKKFYINPDEKINYIFNSSINGIEESDLILLIGTNPRLEATMVNARIRKAFSEKGVQIYSIGNPGDLTYKYKIIGIKQMILKILFLTNQNFLKNYYLQKNHW